MNGRDEKLVVLKTATEQRAEERGACQYKGNT